MNAYIICTIYVILLIHIFILINTRMPIKSSWQVGYDLLITFAIFRSDSKQDSINLQTAKLHANISTAAIISCVVWILYAVNKVLITSSS